MFKKIISIVSLTAFLLVLSVATIASAQNPQPPPPSGLINPLCPAGNPNCARSDAEGLLNSIVSWLLIIATPIAVGMIIYGAFQMIFAGGDPEKFKNGKMTILYTAIGYGIILIGEGITLIIKDVLSK
ncbi:MAG: pilin [Patescibacteria group bacterium]